MSTKDWQGIVIASVIFLVLSVVVVSAINDNVADRYTIQCAARGYAGSTWMGPVRYCWEPLGNGELRLVPYSVVADE